MSFRVNKTHNLRSKSCVEKRPVKCVKFSKSLGDENSFKPEKTDITKNRTCVRTVNNTDKSIKGCSSTVVGFDLSHRIDHKNDNQTEDVELHAELEQPDNFKLAVPELCTSLKIADNLLGAVAMAKDVHKSSSTTFNDGKSVASSKLKALSLMNVPFEEQVFKDLIALDRLDLQCGKDHKLKNKTFERVKDNEPELSNFFKPSFDNEFIVKCAPMTFESDKSFKFNGFHITDRAKHWESIDY